MEFEISQTLCVSPIFTKRLQQKWKNIQKKSKKNDDERETKQEARKDINLKNRWKKKKNQ